MLISGGIVALAWRYLKWRKEKNLGEEQLPASTPSNSPYPDNTRLFYAAAIAKKSPNEVLEEISMRNPLKNSNSMIHAFATVALIATGVALKKFAPLEEVPINSVTEITTPAPQ